MVVKTSKDNIHFSDYPEFTPNLTPQEMFEMGSFGGTYWRPIYSSITKKHYKNVHLHYPKSWWAKVPDNMLTSDWEDYNQKLNYYQVKVGTTLEFWESKHWITKSNPYGWVHWYCDFYMGKRGPDDEWQIKRWLNTAGPNSRFRRALINKIHSNNTKCDDYSISPKIRQTLQHWAYKLTRHDCK